LRDPQCALSGSDENTHEANHEKRNTKIDQDLRIYQIPIRDQRKGWAECRSYILSSYQRNRMPQNR